MNWENIIFWKEKKIGFITLNRPEVYNALNHRLLVELNGAIDEVKRDSEIGAIILTGAGDKAFVSGADINELSQMHSSLQGFDTAIEHRSIIDKLEHLGKPSIAAINGYCLGGGLELAMACSIRIASEKARLGLPELGLGIVPGYGGTQRLTRLVGRGKAIEMILTAKPIDAQEAYRIGLVNQVVPHEELMPKAIEMAESILKNGQTAIRLAMDLVIRGMDIPLDHSLKLESALSALTIGSPEALERLKAFLEKRK